MALRERLQAEFTVFGYEADPAQPQHETAVSGISDAVAINPDGKIEVVIDWKSDVSPSPVTRENYRRQVREYLHASCAERGLIVYMTLGQVEDVTLD